MDWTIAAFGTACLPAFIWIAKFLIDYYSEQQKDVERYKAKIADRVLDSLSNEILALKTSFREQNKATREDFKTLRREIADHKALILSQKAQIETVMKVFEGTLDSARKIANELDERVDYKIKTEITKIGNMIKVGQKKINGGRGGK